MDFYNTLQEPLPSHTNVFIEYVESELGEVSVYYEEASDLFTVYIEKSHQTPEEKKKQQELLKKLKYDPKTKTIEVDGHRAPFKIDREDPDNAAAAFSKLNKKERKILDNHNNKTKLEREKALKNDHKLQKNIKNVHSKISAKSHNKDASRDILNSSRLAYIPSNTNARKATGIQVGKNNMDEDSILHELGHVRDLSNRRRAEAEPSYVAKYGTKELSKEVRKARLELNKLNKLEPWELKIHPGSKERKKELEKIVQKGIEATPSYKKDKGQQKRDAIEKMDKNIKNQILYGKNRRDLNSHDIRGGEYYADAYAMKHSTTKSMYKDINSDLVKRKNKALKSGRYRTAGNIGNAIRSTKQREKIAKGALKKNKDAID